MKVELKTIEAEQKPLKFPVLAKFKQASSEDLVIMFIDDTTGILIVCVGSSKSPGAVRYGLIPIYREDKWEILPAGTQVTFTQE